MESSKLIINTLVTHLRQTELGIGVIAKKLKSTYKVNFGVNQVMLCKPTDLRLVDISETTSITYKDFKSRIINDKSTLNNVILGNECLEYVGISWISIGIVTRKDLAMYPRVVE